MKIQLASVLFAVAINALSLVGNAKGFSEADFAASADSTPAADALYEPLAVNGLSYSGTTVGGPTFNRPVAGSPPMTLSLVGTAVSYDFVQFSIATAGVYNFLSLSVSPAGWDNFTFLYQNSFNPASPLTNVLIGNDDFPTIGRSGFSYNLSPGVNYIFVTTGFSNTDAGTFNNSVTAVPEPSTYAMMLGAGLTGMLVWGKRRRPVWTTKA